MFVIVLSKTQKKQKLLQYVCHRFERNQKAKNVKIL
jgi:hypothetical protein